MLRARSMTEHIHPEFDRFLSPEEREERLGQRGLVVWMTGLSGSGKSTLANAAERALFGEGRLTVILDGDNLRSGLNSDLGFSDADRAENVRRTAEVANLFAMQGTITLVSLISPKNAFRAAARAICGDRYREVYVRASYEDCARRDPKGLYKKAAQGKVAQFTGRDSGFEEPESPDLVLDTTASDPETCARQMIDFIRAESAR